MSGGTITKRSKELVEQLCHCPKEYCLMKVMVSALHPRIIEQVDCVEIFKYELGVVSRREVRPEEAWSIWANRGYALAFDKLYSEDKDPRVLYNEILAQNGGLRDIIASGVLGSS